MTPERYTAICELFDRAMDVSSTERAAFLRQACGADQSLRQEVEQMLAYADSAPEHALARAPCLMNLKALLSSPEPEKLRVGQRIGPYQIERLVGSGGMGTVFRAARIDDYTQSVAVKILRHGFDTDELRQRFRTERQVLAGLDHPHIARLLDGGTTDNGQPYLVMEYIDGEPITSYCESQKLPTRARVELFRVVCLAVQHAHDREIVHRDLKPGNIIVTDEGREARGEGRGTRGENERISNTTAKGNDLGCRAPLVTPKIVDFGLAKCLGEAPLGGAGSDQTQTGAVLGTPSYMSPEQAAGTVRAIGPAADVYALGAIFYELLTGKPPFRGETTLDTLQQVLSADPLPPGRLHPHLSRDLETICLKCLRKEPQRRYSSAAELALDLERHLDGKPIQARPVGGFERAGKWVMRRPAAAALILVTTLAVAGLAAGALWHQARLQRSNDDLQTALDETKRQHVRAEESFRQAREAVDYYFDKLSESAVLKEPRVRALRKELLTEALRYYQAFAEERKEDPELGFEVAKAQLRIGQVHGQLGDHQACIEAALQAVSLFEQRVQAGPRSVRDRRYLAWSYEELGMAHGWLGHSEAAEWAKKRSLELREQIVREEPDKLLYRSELARIYHNLGAEHGEANRLTEAYNSFARAAELCQQLIKNNSENAEYQLALAAAQQEMGKVKAMRGDLSGALFLHQQAYACRERIARAQPNRRGIDFELACSLLEIAQLHQEQGLLQAAQADYCQTIERLERVHQKDPANAPIRGMLRLAYLGRAAVATNLMLYASAIPDLDKAIELSAGPERAEARLHRARIWALAGDLPRAAAETKNVVDAIASRPGLLFLAARVYAIASKIARGEAKWVANDRELHAEQYAVQAMALLDRVQAASGFADAGLRSQLMQEADLTPLRARGDFRKLVGATAVSKKSP